ncbi:MAG TPA: DUF1800 domain-containing protein [Rhizomicrobium sp.]|jgi:uncharacterized protein (DUF1800 family)|nr:DUF1800 domain-containing protein [Rhizomicrobium sp.]
MLDKTTALHLSNRLGFGPAPGDLARIADAGLDNYIQAQLHPQTASLPHNVTSMLRSLPSFGKDTGALYAEYWWRAQVPDPKALAPEEKKKLKRREKQVLREAQNARLARAIISPWQLHEALVEFWFNHFNVYEKKGADKIWVGAYEEEAIRPHTLGRFSDMLLATARHPAMLVYLDNAKNVAPAAAGKADEMNSDADPKKKKKKKESGINENYAREVMELHTLGVDGGYTQGDVISLAHILTGWTVGSGGEADAADAAKLYKRDKGSFHFARRKHDPAQETLLGRSFGGEDVNEGEQALLMLAAHPATAHHISYQLAQYFVADKPDGPLVEAMAKTFRTSGGDIRAVMGTMLTNPAFLASSNVGTKYKTPYRYVVSAARAAGIAPDNRTVAALSRALMDLGQPLYGCITPDGYACTQTAWLDPDGLLHRISFATELGNGAYSGYASNGDLDPPDPDRIAEAVGPALSKQTRAAIEATQRGSRAGAILGSPDFMRC